MWRGLRSPKQSGQIGHHSLTQLKEALFVPNKPIVVLVDETVPNTGDLAKIHYQRCWQAGKALGFFHNTIPRCTEVHQQLLDPRCVR